MSFVLIHPMYELHRDEYLYLAESDHLAWGYLEAPPLLSFLGYLSKLFGNSIGAVRFWGALFGALNIILIGKMVESLGGKTYACLLACLAFFVGGYLRMNIYFNPIFGSLFLDIKFILFDSVDKNRLTQLSVSAGYRTGFFLLFKVFHDIPVQRICYGISADFTQKVVCKRSPLFCGLLFLVLAAPNMYWQICT